MEQCRTLTVGDKSSRKQFKVTKRQYFLHLVFHAITACSKLYSILFIDFNHCVLKSRNIDQNEEIGRGHRFVPALITRELFTSFNDLLYYTVK